MAKQHIAQVGIPDLRRDALEHHAHGGANAVEGLAAMELPGHRTGRAHGIEDQARLELAAPATLASLEIEHNAVVVDGRLHKIGAVDHLAAGGLQLGLAGEQQGLAINGDVEHGGRVQHRRTAVGRIVAIKKLVEAIAVFPQDQGFHLISAEQARFNKHRQLTAGDVPLAVHLARLEPLHHHHLLAGLGQGRRLHHPQGAPKHDHIPGGLTAGGRGHGPRDLVHHRRWLGGATGLAAPAGFPPPEPLQVGLALGQLAKGGHRVGIGAREGLEHIGARLQGRQGCEGVGKALFQFGLQVGQQGQGLGGRALPEPGLEIHRLLQRPTT